MSLLDIPEYAAAVNAETVARELAYMPRPVPICGVSIVHLSARRFMVLAGCGNRFLVGGTLRAIDVAFWLWAMSPDYSTEPRAREQYVKRTVGPRLKTYVLQLETAQAIRAYMAGALQDRPAGGGSDDKLYTAGVTGLVDLFGSEYGWTLEQVMEAPLAVLFQQIKRIERRNNPRAVQFNPSDRVLAQVVRERLNGAN